MKIYIARIRLEDGVVEMPHRYSMEMAEADAKKLEERYAGVPHGIIWIDEYGMED